MSKADGGLYKNVKMSVKTADRLILIGIAALIIVTLILVNNGGFTVSFDTNGGTAVEPQRFMYGETVEVIAPTKDGFEFGGWYLDRDCTVPWNSTSDPVTESMTLYAKWE